MENGLATPLNAIRESIPFFIPELILSAGILLIIISGLIRKNNLVITFIAFSIFVSLILLLTFTWNDAAKPVTLFGGMIRHDSYANYFKLLFDTAALLTVFMTWRNKKQEHLSEYYALLSSVVLGAHLLVMSVNLIMVFISLELVSISSYLLTGFSFSKKSAEGSLKYFLFGSVASAIMLYGFSILYGLTGTLDFSSAEFFKGLLTIQSPLFLISGLMALAGFIYKIAAAPMHPWSPDVYEAAPMPVVAFFSVVPKLSGVAILTRFIPAIDIQGKSGYDWQLIVVIIALLSLTIGNFSALWQKNPKRMMAYSSIAQSGFLLVGVAAFSGEGIHFMLFYAAVYLLMNFVVFLYLQVFEFNGVTTIAAFEGAGKNFPWPMVFMLVALISLTGLPPTSGFTAKLFVFSALWESYSVSGKPLLLVLLVFGLLNTVVSLFYYLRIPYYAFIKSGQSPLKTNNLTFENFLGLILVLAVLYLFFNPELLMGWINKITFVR
ncbi:MAG TPA: NADH-quinone oxidoreductase subunit N [Ohtaekwangia sp.]